MFQVEISLSPEARRNDNHPLPTANIIRSPSFRSEARNLFEINQTVVKKNKNPDDPQQKERRDG